MLLKFVCGDYGYVFETRNMVLRFCLNSLLIYLNLLHMQF